MQPPATIGELLNLELHGPDTYIGTSPEYPWGPRVYGGLVTAQALAAAADTVEARFMPHSLHAYFIRGGTHTEPIRYEVDRIRNGRSFVTRRVVARQSGGAIFNLSASFHIHEDQVDIQTSKMPEVGSPEDYENTSWTRAYDRRVVTKERNRFLVWIKTNGSPTTPLGPDIALAYISDDFPMGAIGQIHPIRRLGDEVRDQFIGASLDHSLWIHRPIPRDEWLLFQMRSQGMAGGRGLGAGQVFSQDGIHLATLAQEGLLRHIGKPDSG